MTDDQTGRVDDPGEGDGTGARSTFENVFDSVLNDLLDAYEGDLDLMEPDDLREGRSDSDTARGRRQRGDGLRGLTPRQAVRALRRLAAILGPLGDMKDVSDAADVALEELPGVIANRDNIIEYRRATDEDFDEASIRDTGIPILNYLIGATIDRRYLPRSGGDNATADVAGDDGADTSALDHDAVRRRALREFVERARRRAFERAGLSEAEGLALFAFLHALRRAVVDAAAQLRSLEVQAGMHGALGLSEAERASLAESIEEARTALDAALTAYDAAWRVAREPVEQIRRSIDSDVTPGIRGGYDMWLEDTYPELFQLPAQSLQVPWRELPEIRRLLEDPVNWRDRLGLAGESTSQVSPGFALPGGVSPMLAAGAVGIVLVVAAALAMLTGGGEVEAEADAGTGVVTGTAALPPDLPPPQVHRISATLAVPVTTYTIDASDPAGGVLTYEWSMSTTVDHERCGTPEVPWTRPGQTVRWSHGDQSPDNCAHVGTNHDVLVTVTATSSASGRAVRCTVTGSDPFSTDAPACAEVGDAAAGAAPDGAPGDDADAPGGDPPDGAPPPDGRAPSHAATAGGESVWVADACILRVHPAVYGMPAYQVRGTLEGTFDFTGDPFVSQDGLLGVRMLVEGAGQQPTEAAYRVDWDDRELAPDGAASIAFFIQVPIAVEAILDVTRWPLRQAHAPGEGLDAAASLAHVLGVPGAIEALRGC
jgi:hypothetical protein